MNRPRVVAQPKTAMQLAFYRAVQKAVAKPQPQKKETKRADPPKTA